MGDHTFTITMAGYELQFSGPRATTAADSFLRQFRERAALMGEAAALESVANWCETLPATPAQPLAAQLPEPGLLRHTADGCRDFAAA